MLDTLTGKTVGIAERAALEAALLDDIAAMVPGWRAGAAVADADAAVPEAELAQLREAGALVAPLPVALGGLGLGTEAHGASGLLALLRLIGRGNLSVGRIVEGHVNALKLIALYGSAEQLRGAAADVARGHLFAIWATEAADPVRVVGTGPRAELHGSKSFCSAAAQATRALVTATQSDGSSQLVLVALPPGERAQTAGVDLHGMRGCGTGAVALGGIAAPPGAMIGQAGDYLRQPAFTAGAWRACAVALGGLDALVAELLHQLVARGRQDHPQQQARIGEVLVAAETAALWAAKAARIGEGAGDAGDVANYVNLARCAIERACLDVMRMVQRSLGLAAFARANPVERLGRDLATYLRQPAPDEALTDAAAWFTRRPLP